MTPRTPGAYLHRARRQLQLARGNLVAALELIATQSYPHTFTTGLAEALIDNQASSDYLTDLMHTLQLTAPPIKL